VPLGYKPPRDRQTDGRTDGPPPGIFLTDCVWQRCVSVQFCPQSVTYYIIVELKSYEEQLLRAYM